MSDAVPSKEDVICPASLNAGWIQNYRVSYAKKTQMFTSRPQKADKTKLELFSKYSNGEGKHTFTLEEGIKAKKQAREFVINGIMKPPTNWDSKWKQGDDPTAAELKKKYAWLHEAAAQVPVEDHTEDDEVYDEEGEPIEEEMLEGKDEQYHKSFAVTAIPETEDVTKLSIKYRPLKPQIHVNSFSFVDPEGKAHEFYLLQNEETGEWQAFKPGMNEFSSRRVELDVPEPPKKEKKQKPKNLKDTAAAIAAGQTAGQTLGKEMKFPTFTYTETANPASTTTLTGGVGYATTSGTWATSASLYTPEQLKAKQAAESAESVQKLKDMIKELEATKVAKEALEQVIGEVSEDEVLPEFLTDEPVQEGTVDDSTGTWNNDELPDEEFDKF